MGFFGSSSLIGLECSGDPWTAAVEEKIKLWILCFFSNPRMFNVAWKLT